MINIAFTGGGSGGHIFPGLAVASELKHTLPKAGITMEKVNVFWIGSSAGMDKEIIEETGLEFFGIPAGKLRRYFSLRTIADFFKVIGGFFSACRILSKKKAVILFSKGGFVSVPPCAAAAFLGIPVYTHESDFSPGLATKINSRFVMRTKGKIFTAYNDTCEFFPPALRKHITVSGNPVRKSFHCADAEKGRAFLGVGNEKILLVLGGSQGAKEINEFVRDALSALTEKYIVVHQSGTGQMWDMPSGTRYKNFPFIKEEMPHIMAAAEIVMGRSGAGIWEWAVLGKPMILIPLCGSGTRGDQAENARYFEKAGAALVLTGKKACAETLAEIVCEIADNAEKRNEMSRCSQEIGKREGSEFIARILAGEVKNIMEGKIEFFRN